MNNISIQSPVFQQVIYNNKAYFTSQYFYDQYKANAGEKFYNLANFNRHVRSIEAYDIYLMRGDVVELTWKKAKASGIQSMIPLFESVSYNPLLLINETLQVALMHYLDDAISKEASVRINAAVAQQKTYVLPRSFSEALRMLADETDEKEKAVELARIAEERLIENKPKIEFAEAVQATIGCDVGSFAKTLGYGRNTFFKMLRDDGYLMMDGNTPYQKYINQGLFEVVEHEPTIDKYGRSHAMFTTTITGKGQAVLAKRYTRATEEV